MTILSKYTDWVAQENANLLKDEKRYNEKIQKEKLEEVKEEHKKYLKKINRPINMATGGLMNRPIGSREEDKKDTGISAYDVSTPESARQGMPSRVLGKDRTRFTGGGFTQAELDLLKAHKYKASEVAKWKDGGKELIKSLKNIYVLKSKGGLLGDIGKYKRKKYDRGDKVSRDELETIDEDAWEYMTDESDIAQNKSIDAQIEREEIRKEIARADNKDTSTMDRNIEKLKAMKNKKVVTAALGGYMDENDIAEQTPLALSIGGQAALGEKYDRRKDYQAYAEGDEVIAEEEMIEEPLMAPTGMDTDSPMLEEDIDAIGETETEMMAEDEMQDADSVLDTSALSEDEESIFNEALEMFPELEAILPKVIATEFTEDELVEGPGTGTSDSIPALLSDGEFVFTAKAVKNIGIDKLRKMMKQAEEAYDAGMVEQEDAATMASEEESLLA